jgi:4-amino-4-deoxy-L-arabinose transferase-like glycosyltransferase
MRLGLFLIFVTVVRLVVATVMPLSADEAYYWVWSKALAPGFLDHPPMVALWIRAGTWIAGDTPLGVRLLGPLAALLGTLLLRQAGRDLAPGTGAGDRAAWMLNGTLLLNAGAVTMTPDTPLLLFWTACLAALARLMRSGDGAWLLAAGAAAGLALDSKYTAALLAPGILAWLLGAPAARVWLARWQLYAAAAIAAALFAPVLAWNAAHHWASLAKQGGRSADFHPADAAGYLAELLGGQVGLATPLLAGVFCLGVWRIGRNWRQPGPALLLALTVLPAAVFVQHALGDRVQANWPAVIYPAAALAAGMAGVRFWRGATVLGVAMSALLFVQAAAAPFKLPRRVDFTVIRLGGWATLARDVARQAELQHAGFVVADEYELACELAFRLPGPVIGAEWRWALFKLPPAGVSGTGLLVRTTRRAPPPDKRFWPDAVPVGSLVRGRGGVTAETYILYRVTLPRGLPAVRLPSLRPPSFLGPPSLTPAALGLPAARLPGSD